MATSSSSWAYLLVGVLHESRRVVSSHSRHFLALSVLFLLPLSFLLLSSPLLLSSLSPSSSSHPQSLLRSYSISLSPPPPPIEIGIGIGIVAISLLLSLAASAATAFSVHRSLLSRPVNLGPTLRSLPLSLLRLTLTLLASLLPISILSLLLYSLFLISPKLLPFLLLALSLSILHFSLSFSLAFPVAVLESSYGFPALFRSRDLLRGMRGPALCLLLSFAAAVPLVVWAFGLRSVGTTSSWQEVARTVGGSAATVLLLLYGFVTNVVLYVYCKAVRGELAEEVAREFVWEYVCLPADPDKVPHVVSVIRQ